MNLVIGVPLIYSNDDVIDLCDLDLCDFFDCCRHDYFDLKLLRWQRLNDVVYYIVVFIDLQHVGCSQSDVNLLKNNINSSRNYGIQKRVLIQPYSEIRTRLA